MQFAEGNSQSAIVGAARWIEGLLTGNLATALVTIVIACAGLMILQGRLAPRRGMQIVLGAFILFGAPSIASGIAAAAQGAAIPTNSAAPAVAPPTLPSAAPQFDPYAGAATPR